MLDSIYYPEPLRNEPDWFNGFVHIETHPKEKYGWNRYVYLPDYYTDEVDLSSLRPELSEHKIRFEEAVPKENFISELHSDYFDRTKTRVYSVATKEGLGIKSLGAVTILNGATGKKETHRYLWANKDYIIRQLDKYDKPEFTSCLTRAGKSIGTFLRLQHFDNLAETGMMIAPISMEGDMHGLQAFSFVDNGVSPEPLTYIDPEGRGQGVFNIYHDAVVEFGEACGAEFIYAHCSVKNQKIQDVYEAYGYIKQEKTKTVGRGYPEELYMFRYPLKTKQQTLF